jgi:hypothetical protein
LPRPASGCANLDFVLLNERVFAYDRRVIRVRGVPVSDDEVRELAHRLSGDEAAESFVDRLGRALDDGGGLIATDRLEARAVLFAVQAMLAEREYSERLLELRGSLVAMLGWG